MEKSLPKLPKLALWSPLTGGLTDIQTCFLACYLPIHQELTEQLLFSYTHVKISGQLKFIPMEMLIPVYGNAYPFHNTRSEIASQISKISMSLVSRLDLVKECQYWSEGITPINRAQVSKSWEHISPLLSFLD